jgi:hypothetical protein
MFLFGRNYEIAKAKSESRPLSDRASVDVNYEAVEEQLYRTKAYPLLLMCVAFVMCILNLSRRTSVCSRVLLHT